MSSLLPFLYTIPIIFYLHHHHLHNIVSLVLLYLSSHFYYTTVSTVLYLYHCFTGYPTYLLILLLSCISATIIIIYSQQLVYLSLPELSQVCNISITICHNIPTSTLQNPSSCIYADSTKIISLRCHPTPPNSPILYHIYTTTASIITCLFHHLHYPINLLPLP